MTLPVEFALALSNSYPSGTGSYNYNGSFKLVVQNLAYQKQVSIWAQVGTTWHDIPATYLQSLPGNVELWTAPATDSEDQFVARYSVNGSTYWDNNGGQNYRFPKAYDEFVALAGANYKVVLGNAGLAGGNLTVEIGVQNLAYHKSVGIVYSTDNWTTVITALAGYSFTMSSGLEVWHLTAAVGGATEVKFAIFYDVLGQEYWDNNFSRNYRVAPGVSATWGTPP